MKKLIYVLIVLLSIAAVGCKKDKLSIADKLAGKWTYVKHTEQSNSNPETVYTTQEQVIYDFKADGNLIITSNNITTQRTWKLIDDHLLRYDNDNPIFDNTISQLDEHNLIYYFEVQDANGTTRATFYFTK